MTAGSPSPLRNPATSKTGGVKRVDGDGDGGDGDGDGGGGGGDGDGRVGVDGDDGSMR